MPYKLGYFDKLIEELSEMPANNLTNEEYIAYVTSIKKATKSVQSVIVRAVCAFTEVSQTEVYISHHQLAIVIMADAIQEHLAPSDALQVYNISSEPTMANLWKTIFVHLEKLLLFLRDKYGDNITKHNNAPVLHCIAKAEEITGEIERLQQAMNLVGTSPRIIDVALSPLQHYCDRDPYNTTYQHFEYLQLLITGLYNAISGKLGRVAVNNRIREFLLDMNLNSLAFLDYYTTTIEDKISKIDNMPGKRFFLYETLKSIDSPKPRKQVAYNTQRLHIRELIAGWLEYELNYMQDANGPSGKPIAESIRYKLKTILSVPKLGGLVRVLVDFGLFPLGKDPKAKGELLRFITESVASLRQEDMSFENFRKKFNQLDEATARALIDLFYELISFTKKHYLIPARS